MRKAFWLALVAPLGLAACGEPYVVATSEQGVLIEEVTAYNTHKLDAVAAEECAKFQRAAKPRYHGGDYVIYDCIAPGDGEAAAPDAE